jgi:hypothetical protein
LERSDDTEGTPHRSFWFGLRKDLGSGIGDSFSVQVPGYRIVIRVRIAVNTISRESLSTINVRGFCFAIRGELLSSDLVIAQEDAESMLFSFDMDGSE